MKRKRRISSAAMLLPSHADPEIAIPAAEIVTKTGRS